MFSDAFQWHFPTPPTGDYLTVIVDLMRPLSRNGYVKLNSADPLEQPYINLNFSPTTWISSLSVKEFASSITS